MLPEYAGLEVLEFRSDQVIFEAGDEAAAAYVIESGAVEVLQSTGNGYRRINMLSEGALFGEIALLDGGTRSATVRALTPTRVISINRSHLENLMGKTDPVVKYIVRILLEHVRRSAQGAPLEATTLSSFLAPAAMSGDGPEAATKLHQDAIRILTLAQSLSNAIDGNQLELHYQPIIRFADRSLAGYEALVRWRHPTLGMVRPDEFIPLAEKTDLIHRIGEFVLNRALDDWPELRSLCGDLKNATPFMSINLSAPEFCRPGILGRIQESLETRQIPPAELRIELTETVIISNVQLVSEVVQRLRGIGVGIALDDFGKGYGGLDYLQALPFSCLKIDKSFVDKMETSERSKEIIQSTLDLAARLRMSTVAEGIEDEQTAQRLSDMRCAFAQGYYFARPMPVPSLLAWHAARA